MGFVVSLTGVQPSPRFDNLPWTQGRVEEGPNKSGPWTALETIVLTPSDPDPTNPVVRNFTTVLATAAEGLWYRIAFLDASANEQFSLPSFNGPSPESVPSAAEIRVEYAQIGWAELGYPAPADPDSDPDGLDTLVDEAIAELQSLIGIVAEDVTDGRAALVRRALRMLVAYNAAGQQMEILESAADFDLLSSMSASSYSETRRNIAPNSHVLHTWPALNKLLHGILFFSEAGQKPTGPAIDVTDPIPRPGEWYHGPWPNRSPFAPPLTLPGFPNTFG